MARLQKRMVQVGAQLNSLKQRRRSGRTTSQTRRRGSGGGSTQAKAKALQKILAKYKGCILERYETSATRNLPVRGFARSLEGSVPYALRKAFYGTLKKAAAAGDESTFKKFFKKAVLADCFQCAKHRKWHTKHVHCTMDCGGNNGILKGPCFEGCKAGHDFGRFASKIVNDVRRGLDKAVKWVADTAKKAGKWVDKNIVQPAKQFFKDPLNALCQGLLGPVCPVVKVVIDFFKRVVKKRDVGKAIASMFEDFAKKIKSEVEYVASEFKQTFNRFRKVLVIDRLDRLEPKTRDFTNKTVSTIERLITRLNNNLGIPGPIGKFLAIVSAKPLWPVIYSGVLPLAFINFGFRQLMASIIPQLILGTGKAFSAARYSKAGKMFQGLVSEILKMVGAGGGLLLKFIGDEKTKERIRSLFLRVADVSGKIQKGIEGALKVAEKIRTGSFSGIESALRSTAKLPTRLSDAELGKVIKGLLGFANEQVWAALNPLLRKVLSKVLSMMDRLIDIPRNALVGAVGTVPFAGGVLAAGLNFGLGIIISMIKDFFVTEILKMARKLLDDTWHNIEGKVVQRLLKNRGSRAGARHFIEFVRTVGDLAGEVSNSMKAASKGLQGTIATLVSTALDKFILRGVRNPDVRKILSGAVAEVLKGLAGGPGSFSLTGAVIAVLKRVGGPLSSLVAKSIADRRLQGLVRAGLQRLLAGLANKSGVQRIMGNPVGFLGEVGYELIQQVKPELAKLLLGRLGDRSLAGAVSAAVGELATVVRRRGFSALLQLKELLVGLYRALKKPLLAMLLGKVRNGHLRRILEKGITFSLAELESAGIQGILQKGLGQFFVRLFENVREPLVDLLLEGVPSPALRTAARKAIDAVVEKAKAGRLAEVLNMRKLLAGLVRSLKPAVGGFFSGNAKATAFKKVLRKTVGPVVDQVARVVEGGEFPSIKSVLASVAAAALGALKTYVTRGLSRPFGGVLEQSFDSVLTLLQRPEELSRLCREGPKMLWSQVVAYLESLYRQARRFAAEKAAQVREAIFATIAGIRGSLADLDTIVKNLERLGSLLRGVTLPSPI